MIKIENLSKNFANNQVFSEFSLEIAGLTILKAQSGAGKTTLINILLGFIDYEAGKITNMPNKISVVFQEERLINHLTALDNLKLCTKDTQLCEKLLTYLEIPHNEKICNLSGGMKRRVEVLKALVFNGDFYIFDECTAGLDEENAKKILELIKKIDKPVLFITHSDKEIAFLGAKIDNKQGKFEIYK